MVRNTLIGIRQFTVTAPSSGTALPVLGEAFRHHDSSAGVGSAPHGSRYVGNGSQFKRWGGFFCERGL